MPVSATKALFFIDPPKRFLIVWRGRETLSIKVSEFEPRHNSVAGKIHRRCKRELRPALVAMMVLIAAAKCALNESEFRSGEGQAAPATSSLPQTTSGHPTEKELEAARRQVEKGPLPGPPVPQAGTPKRPPDGSETQTSPLPTQPPDESGSP